MIKEVKKILDEITTSRQYGYITLEDKVKAAQQIDDLYQQKMREVYDDFKKCIWETRPTGISFTMSHEHWKSIGRKCGEKR